MSLSLRKARRLEQAILERIKLENKTEIRFSVFADPPELDLVAKTFFIEVNNKRVLNGIRHNIRSAIAVVNYTSGLNNLIGKEAGAKADIRLLQEVLRSPVRDVTQEQLITKQAAKLNAVNNHEGRFNPESMEAHFLTEGSLGTVKNQLAAAKKIQQDLVDEMLSINMTSSIELSIVDENVLKELGLL